MTTEAEIGAMCPLAKERQHDHGATLPKYGPEVQEAGGAQHSLSRGPQKKAAMSPPGPPASSSRREAISTAASL